MRGREPNRCGDGAHHQLEIGAAEGRGKPVRALLEEVGVVHIAIEGRLEIEDHESDVVNFPPEPLAGETMPELMPYADPEEEGEKANPIPEALLRQVQNPEEAGPVEVPIVDEEAEDHPEHHDPGSDKPGRPPPTYPGDDPVHQLVGVEQRDRDLHQGGVLGIVESALPETLDLVHHDQVALLLRSFQQSYLSQSFDVVDHPGKIGPQLRMLFPERGVQILEIASPVEEIEDILFPDLELEVVLRGGILEHDVRLFLGAEKAHDDAGCHLGVVHGIHPQIAFQSQRAGRRKITRAAGEVPVRILARPVIPERSGSWGSLSRVCTRKNSSPSRGTAATPTFSTSAR
jgi:hypothetical protein